MSSGKSSPSRDGQGPSAAGNNVVFANKSHFGVLLTGYLEKTNPTKSFDKPKKRFVVLTHMGIHWFKREDGYDLFGEERGSIAVQDISKVDIYSEAKVIYEDSFEVTNSKDFQRRIFRANNKQEAQNWIDAIKAAIRHRADYRRETINNLSFLHSEDDAPNITLVSLKREGGAETVLAKLPHCWYGTKFEIPLLRGTAAVGDKLQVLMHNGATAEVSLRAFVGKPVGDTIPVRVNTPANHVANLAVAIEAIKTTQPTEAEKPKAAMLLVPDFLVPTAFAALLTFWIGQELSSSSTSSTSTISSSISLILTKERVALAIFITITLLRHLTTHPTKKKSPSTTTTTLTLTIDDYLIDQPSLEHSVAGAIPPIPKRFIDGCFGDMVEAERRWRITLAWRAEFGTDVILEQEHPYYDDIKEALPHFYCLNGKDGNPVYYERSGQTNLALAKKVGIDWLVWHYIYTTEFLFKKVHPREEAKTITIFDVQGVGMKDVAGEPFEFIRRASHYMQEHYPERCRVIIIANCPGWFNFIWKMIRPMVNETTQKKVKIVGAGKETQEAIAEFVDLDKMPVEYGGTLKYGTEADSCRWNSPEEVQLREHVYAVNKRFQEARKAKGIEPPARFVPVYGTEVK